jgi:type IV pilus assembly protein PilQ
MKRNINCWMLTIGMLIPHIVAAQGELTQVEAVTVKTESDAVQVHIQTSSPPVYQAFDFENGSAPLKLALDLKNALMVTNTEHVAVNTDPVKQVRISQWYQAPPIVRVIIDLTKKTEYNVTAVADGIRVTIPRSETAAPVIAVTQPAAASTAPPAIEQTPATQTVAPDPRSTQTGARAEASQMVPSPEPPGQPVRAMLNYVDTPLPTVLRVFAELYNLNIVLSSDVAEDPVTVKLDNVDLEPALNAILTANGYNYYRQDNIIIVKPVDSEIRGDLLTEVFKLRYINSFDLIDYITEIITDRGFVSTFEQTAIGDVGVLLPVVSSGEGGGGGDQQTERVEVDTERSDVLIVTDAPDAIERIRKIIKELDVPQKQVRIEAKLIETNLNEDTRWGINWTASAELVGLGGNPTSISQGQTQQNEDGSNVVPGLDLSAGSFKFGTLSLQQLRGLLEFMDQQGETRVLNQPSITVLNNQQADIAVGTLVPIELQQPIITAGGGGAAASQGGGTMVQQQFVSVALTVIPRVNDAHNVTLWVQPVISEITGFTGENNDLPIVSTRSANTQVRVRDTDTVVIGGLTKRDQVRTMRKVKFLGDLPLFGRFFRHETQQEKESELMILITPFIIAGENFGEETALNSAR